MKNWLFPLVFSFPLQIAFAQHEAADSIELEPVTISAYRLETQEIETPLALTRIGEHRLQKGQQQLALNEALAAVPGVFVQNAENFAQDIRVSVRGFGSRAAFGIRGIKIFMDGFPETSPDGQGQVDNIEPGAVHSMEVIRGVASALYGNSSGGVLSFNTLKFKENEFLEASATAGSFGFQKYQLRTGGGKAGKIFYNLTTSFTQTEGYREQSAMENYLINSGVLIPFDTTGHLLLAFNYVNSPQAQDPGAINQDEAMVYPRQARNVNKQFDAGEELEQGRLGISFSKKLFGQHRFSLRTYAGRRFFDNRLAFQPGGVVELERSFFGFRIQVEFQNRLFRLPWKSSVGIDLESQSDHRQRYDNQDGLPGLLVFDMDEEFSGTGVFFIQQLRASERLTLALGLRFDRVNLKAEENLMPLISPNGRRHYERFNPIAGLTYTLSKSVNFYANLGTSYETPTLSELTANPTGLGGFNEDLRPQSATSVEAGLKGWLRQERLRFDVAIFRIKLKNEFDPYELEQFPGRTFFRNTASSVRNGIELGLGTYLAKGFYAYLNYTLSDFRFLENLAGVSKYNKNQPGIPKQTGYLEIRYSKAGGWYGVLQNQLVSAQFADDLNTVKVNGYWLANLRLGYEKRFERWQVEPFMGVNNLFDTFYYSNVRLNAAGGRYFEPASSIHFFGGIRIRIG